MASIAARYGVGMEALLDREGNRALVDTRGSAHILLPGDIVDVPEQPARHADFSSGGTRRFRAHVPKTKLRLALHDHEGNAAANKRFELHLPGARRPIEGTTDGDGKLDVEVPVTHRTGTLLLWLDGEEPLKLPLLIGHLDPKDEASGVRHRLTNLRYDVGDGASGLAVAVRAFQAAESLPVTGVVDDATRDRLVERHGT